MDVTLLPFSYQYHLDLIILALRQSVTICWDYHFGFLVEKNKLNNSVDKQAWLPIVLYKVRNSLTYIVISILSIQMYYDFFMPS